MSAAQPRLPGRNRLYTLGYNLVFVGFAVESNRLNRRLTFTGDEKMGSGISLLVLALGTLGAGGFLALKARKDVADLKGDPARSSLVHHHGEAPRRNMPGTEH